MHFLPFLKLKFSHLKMGHPKRNLIFQPLISRGDLLVFREGNYVNKYKVECNSDTLPETNIAMENPPF